MLNKRKMEQAEKFIASPACQEAIFQIVGSTSKDDRTDNKNALIALVDDEAGVDWAYRRHVMDLTERALSAAYVVEDDAE